MAVHRPRRHQLLLLAFVVAAGLLLFSLHA